MYWKEKKGECRDLTLPLLDGIASCFPFLVKATWGKGLDVLLWVPVLKGCWKRKFEVEETDEIRDA